MKKLITMIMMAVLVPILAAANEYGLDLGKAKEYSDQIDANRLVGGSKYEQLLLFTIDAVNKLAGIDPTGLQPNALDLYNQMKGYCSKFYNRMTQLDNGGKLNQQNRELYRRLTLAWDALGRGVKPTKVVDELNSPTIATEKPAPAPKVDTPRVSEYKTTTAAAATSTDGYRELEGQVVITSETGTRPMFPGGEEALNKYIAAKVDSYPFDAEDRGLSGHVLVGFTIAVDGSVCNVAIVKGMDPTFDQRAKDIVSGMPNWSPAVLNGQAVNAAYVLPISF